MESTVSNPGSALGEAIGALMEDALNRYLDPLVKSMDCIYITAGPFNHTTKKYTKLILYDAYGNGYNIDSVIANKKFQPLILVESKYIRYKKHNRDKGSWVCNSHQALRRRFSSVRSSITILAGNWSQPSKAMMRSYDITLFEIPFEKIAFILSKYDIDFNWGEKDREKAKRAWDIFDRLDDNKKNRIGNEIISGILDELKESIISILDDSVPREIKEVEIQLSTNLGETKLFVFESVELALKFLQDLNDDEDLFNDLLKTDDSPMLFDNVQIELDE